MNNVSIQSLLDACRAELNHIKTIITSLGIGCDIVPYLTKYAIVRSCGTIEASFKTIIADYCSRRSKKQVKYFLDNKVRENSCNPSYDNICRILSEFDESWKDDFKSQLKVNPQFTKLTFSLQSLVDARNDFAHGGNPTISINDVQSYFLDGQSVIEVLDNVVS